MNLETRDFHNAQRWAEDLFGLPNIFQTWMPLAGFVKAVRYESSLAFTRGAQEPYGLGLGVKVEIDPIWKNFSIPRSIPKDVTADYVLSGQWDAYSIDTRKIAKNEHDLVGYVHLIDDQEILGFLETHAPESSTKPGHPEILFWGGLRDANGFLLAVAALTRWESGGHVLSSVGVHQDHRGLGLAQRLTKAIVGESSQLGISYLALGVAGKNDAAKAVYEKVGFTCMGRFNYFERG